MDWESILSSEGALPARGDGAVAGDGATSDMVIDQDSVQYRQDASVHMYYPLYAYQVKRGKERRNAWHNRQSGGHDSENRTTRKVKYIASIRASKYRCSTTSRPSMYFREN